MLAGWANTFLRNTFLGLSAACYLGVAFASHATAEPVPFLVPTRTVYPGQDVSKGRLEIRHFRASYGANLRAVKHHQQVLGKVAAKTLIPMRPILLKNLREPHLVRAGSRSKLIFSKGALTITAVVTAQEPGSAGDLIRVRNVDSGKYLMARVRPDGELELERP